jgi:type II secretory pathway component GspD/PulD (secretin)
MQRCIIVGIFVAIALATCGNGSNSPAAEEASKSTSPPAVQNERRLFAIQYLEAKELAEQLEAVFNHNATQPVKVITIPETNCLLVSAPKDALAGMETMLAQLDQAPKMVAVDVWIISLQKPGERIDGKDGIDENSLVGPKRKVEEQLAKLGREGRLTVMNHFHAKALSNRQALEQLGAQVPRILATNVNNTGRFSNTQLNNIGSLLKVTPQVLDNERIRLDLDVEKSYIGAEEKGVVISKLNTGEEVRSPTSLTITVKNEVSVSSGMVIKLDGVERPQTDEEESFLILVAAEVLPNSTAR